MAKIKNNISKTKKTDTLIKNNEEKLKENKFFIPENYARSNVQPLWATTPPNSATRVYTSEQINRLLLNPYGNYKELQNISNYLLYNSPMYNNFLDYLSNILTWDYVLECEDVDDVKEATIRNRYYEAAKTVYKINVKTVFPSLLRRSLINGESYFYNMMDDTNNIIVEIDSSICQLSHIDDNNIWRYYVNVSLIDPLRVYEYPKEIQNYYQEWKDGGKKKTKKTIDGISVPEYLYQVSNKGFAIFVHMRKVQHDYPYFAPMFGDLSSLEADKDYQSDYIKENNIKLVHMKVPVNKDTGEPLMEKPIVEAYHESAKSHLPRNTAPLTNPFDCTGIALDKVQSNVINLVEHSNKVVMQDSGISESIFNAASTLGLEYSTLADASKIYPLLYFFENFVNLQIKQYKCKVKFLKINQFNQLDWHERYYSDVQAGGSRSLFAVTSGIEPYDIMNLAKTEKALDMDSWLEPKINSSQLSVDDLKNGRPKKKAKDKTDSANKVDEYK